MLSLTSDQTKFNPHSLTCTELSSVWLFVAPWTAATRLLSMELSRQEYWSWLPFPPPGDLPDPGIDPVSWVSRTGSRLFTTSATWEAQR